MGTITMDPYGTDEIRYKDDKYLGRTAENDIWDILRIHIIVTLREKGYVDVRERISDTTPVSEINDNADTSGLDTDKATDDQTDTESDNTKNDDGGVNPDDSGEAKETSDEDTANEGITTGDSDTGSTADSAETQG